MKTRYRAFKTIRPETRVEIDLFLKKNTSHRYFVIKYNKNNKILTVSRRTEWSNSITKLFLPDFSKKGRMAVSKDTETEEIFPYCPSDCLQVTWHYKERLIINFSS